MCSILCWKYFWPYSLSMCRLHLRYWYREHRHKIQFSKCNIFAFLFLFFFGVRRKIRIHEMKFFKSFLFISSWIFAISYVAWGSFQFSFQTELSHIAAALSNRISRPESNQTDTKWIYANINNDENYIYTIRASKTPKQ